MTETLRYKGWKSTRIQILAVLTLMVTAAYAFASVNAQEWIDFLMWAYGLYAASEVGAKGANAYASKQ